MNRRDCTEFLQWCLPQLRMRWAGFRRVRGQVCKRIDRRIRALGLSGIDAYRAWLEAHPGEWAVLDGLARVTVSRFYRDAAVFDRLEHTVLPACAGAATEREPRTVRLASLGCGSGEEPYSISLLWQLRLKSRLPQVGLEIRAMDADPHLLRRARRACFPAGSMKELPADLRAGGFTEASEGLSLRPEMRRPVAFVRADVRDGIRGGPYDIVLCRNLVFTYFDEWLQARVGGMIAETLRPGGLLVIGRHERLPAALPFAPDPCEPCVHRRAEHDAAKAVSTP